MRESIKLNISLIIHKDRERVTKKENGSGRKENERREKRKERKP
jgi:hypothetical protein